MPKCPLCAKPTGPKTKYCLRCERLLTSRNTEKLSRRTALRSAYDISPDRLRNLAAGVCH